MNLTFYLEQLKTFKEKKSLIRVCFRKIIGYRCVLWCQQQDRNRGCLGINTRRRHQRTPEPVQEARGQRHGMEVGSTARFPTTEWGAARIPAKAAEERAWECTWLARGCFFQAETAAQLAWASLCSACHRLIFSDWPLISSDISSCILPRSPPSLNLFCYEHPDTFTKGLKEHCNK